MRNDELFTIALKVADLKNQFSEKKVAWKQHLLLVSTTLLGVLVALHRTSIDNPLSRYLWAASVVLLALGILCNAVALYTHIESFGRLLDKYRREAPEQYQEQGYALIDVDDRKIFVIAEQIGYGAYIASVVMLAVYSCVSA